MRDYLKEIVGLLGNVGLLVIAVVALELLAVLLVHVWRALVN